MSEYKMDDTILLEDENKTNPTEEVVTMKEKKPKKIPNKIKWSVGYKIFNIFNIIFMVLLSLAFIVPYLHIVAKAFNTGTDTNLGGITIFPRDFTFKNITFLFQDAAIWSAIVVSIARTFIGAIVAVFLQYTVAYVLLQKGLPFRGFIVWFFTIPIFFSGGLAAEMLMFNKLAITDTFWVYILPASFSFYNMVIIRTYLQGIPESLIESARLDGANEFTVLMRIMFPLSLPIIATIFLWSAVAQWNNWLDTLYYVKWEHARLDTLQYLLQQSVRLGAQTNMDQDSGITSGAIDTTVTQTTLEAAQVVLVTLPIICVYPFLQKYFVTGITLGGVKE